jgi:hypothetical protein
MQEQEKKGELSAVEAARLLHYGLDYLYGLIWTGKLEARSRQLSGRMPHERLILLAQD